MIHPDKRSKKKTDRRDAHKLSESLWLNRKRLAGGQKPQGLRRVHIPTLQDQENRQISSLRKRLGQKRTRTINQVKRILHRHNRMWECPTKTFKTQAVQRWLSVIDLPPIDRLEMDQLRAQWKLWNQQMDQAEEQIAERFHDNPNAVLLSYIPGISCYSALTIASHIGDISRFPRPRSLANYFGLTPGCRNSGEVTDRLGSITKEGSQIVRLMLAEAVIHVLKRDRSMRAWYGRIKKRRGSRIARVAVMRRLATIIWHMLSRQEAYYPGGPPRVRLAQQLKAEQLKEKLTTVDDVAAIIEPFVQMARAEPLTIPKPRRRLAAVK